jgi:shikimate dehydrogenase
MTKRIVLIGHPVAHSLSAAMQQAAFDALKIDARYELWDRPPIELAGAVGEIRKAEFIGANVTIPHKERVVPLMDRLTEEAQATGAVNTITREGRRLVGHNTDVAGFEVALDQLVGRQKMPRHAVVLGAGGGARAVPVSCGSSSSTATFTGPRAWSVTSPGARPTWTSGRCRGTTRSSSRSWPRRSSSSMRPPSASTATNRPCRPRSSRPISSCST